MGSDEWEELIAGEQQPFGDIGMQLEWRRKTLTIGARDQDGRLLAAAGIVPADVLAGPRERFTVTGLGGVIVTRSARGRGLGRAVIERALEAAREMAPERAMLFCLAANVPLYEKFGFLPLEGPVTADQPSGPVEIPMPAMWKPLRPRVGWPAGAVTVIGEPF